MLLDEHARGGAARRVVGQSLPGVASADGNLAVLEGALEGLEPVLGVALEGGALFGGLVLPRRDPLPVQDAGPGVGQPLQRLNDLIEGVEAAQVVLVPIGRELVVVADQQPPMARLQGQREVEAVRLPGLLDDGPVEGLVGGNGLELAGAGRAVGQVRAALDQFDEIGGAGPPCLVAGELVGHRRGVVEPVLLGGRAVGQAGEGAAAVAQDL